MYTKRTREEPSPPLQAATCLAMSLEMVEAILEEQSQALSAAQRCQDQIKGLLRDYLQRHHTATHNSRSGERHQQDNFAAPFEQAAPIRQEQQPAITCEDSHSDEDFIQGLQVHEWRRA